MPEESPPCACVAVPVRCGWDAESQPGDEELGTSSSPEGLFWVESYECSWNITHRGQPRDRSLLQA